MKDWGRLLTALITPFNNDGSVNYDLAKELAKRLLDEGNDGFVICGTTGESPTVSKDEKLKLFEAVKSAVGDNAAVIANVGTYNTAESVEFAKEVNKLGLDGAMAVSPYYSKPTQEGLFQHFSAIAAAVNLPLLIYNIQGRTAVNIETSTLIRLTNIPNVVGVKEASGNMSQISDVIAQAPSGFRVYSGDDLLTLPILSVGGYGVISVTSHIVSRDIRAMIDAFLKGDNATAATLHCNMLSIIKAAFCAGNPSSIKYALKALGIPVGIPRLPVVEPANSDKAFIESVLKSYGLIS